MTSGNHITSLHLRHFGLCIILEKKSLLSLRVGALTGPVILGSESIVIIWGALSTFGDVKLCFFGSFLNPFNKEILEVFGELEILGGVAKVALEGIGMMDRDPKMFKKSLISCILCSSGMRIQI